MIKGTGNIPKKLNDAATVVASVVNVSDRYVRQVIAKGYTPKGKNAMVKAEKIKKLYRKYSDGKSKLITDLQKLAKTA
jgi:hypothetical protein